jgi:hypothetical protein
MNKLLRILFVLSLVAVVTLLAKNSVAWAGFTPGNEASIASNAADPAPASRAANRGTVKPPPSRGFTIRSAGSYSAGGFCLIKVEYLSPEFFITVERSYYSGFGKPLPVPDGIFLSALCHLQYYNIAGQHVFEIPPDQGSVQICFAAIPFRTGDIYVYFPPSWTDQPTTTVGDLLACSPANQTGYYVRRGR